MTLAVITVCIAILCFAIFRWIKQTKQESELERHSISAQDLHTFMGSGQQVLVFDVRQALDLLAYPEQVPGAQRVPPEELLANAATIPMDKDAVIYCTCPSDKTSRMVLRRLLALGFSRVKVLRGGLAGWKGMGFPVEPYRGTLTFSSAATTPRSGSVKG